jgi:hypothetical protein
MNTMDNNYDNIKSFLEHIKSISFFSRIFNWKNVKSLLFNAIADLQKIASNQSFLLESNIDLKSKNSELSKDLELSRANLAKTAADFDTNQNKLRECESKINQSLAEIASYQTTIENLKSQISQLETEIALTTEQGKLTAEECQKRGEKLAALNETIQKTAERKNELELANQTLTITNENLVKERNEMKDENTRYNTTEEERRMKHEKDISTLNAVISRIEKERKDEIDQIATREVEKIRNLKETWSKHQTNVRSSIKAICQKHIIEFVEKVPFKGEPDNTLKICNEFVIFDAKSPASDDLTNFPNYLKDQAEKAKKYAKQEDVKKDVFFVVPTNTLESLNQFVFNLGDYDVFVISIDSLEQIVLNLKKIESYEFAENLSPEERENICRVIGKFAHLTKRRIQIDSFFAKRFLEIAFQSEADLPEDILKRVIEFEKSEKINPPQEKRVKAISTKDLIKDTNKLNTEVASKGIMLDSDVISGSLNGLNLYNDNNDIK